MHRLRTFIAVAGYAILHVHASPVLDARQSTSGLPVGWMSLGCYSDTPTSRTLKTAAYTDVTGMTIESCIAFCTPAGYQYAGVEFSRECYCDNLIESTGAPASDGCTMACTGNSAETCGGDGKINIFSLTTSPPPPAGWAAAGCYNDTAAARTLKTASFTSVNDMTIEACTDFCTPAGYQYAGLEFGRECYCDNVIEPTGALTTDGGCNMPCTGNGAEICGGSDRLSVFQSTAIPPPPASTIKPTVGNFQYKGCFQDGVNGAPRTLLNMVTVAGGVSAESCTSACHAAGFPLAGLEFGQECWCDSYMELVTVVPDSECNMPCQADATEICGAGNRLAVYQDTTATPPDSQQCLSNTQIQAVTFGLQSIPIPNGGTSRTIGALEFAAVVGSPSWFILSTGGTAGPTESITYTLGRGVFRPTSFEGEGTPIPVAPNVGSGQVFALFSLFTAYNQYCAKPNPVSLFGPFIGPPVLSVNGHADQWGLCANHTAGGRLDIVYSPIATSHDYALSDCQSVILQMH